MLNSLTIILIDYVSSHKLPTCVDQTDRWEMSEVSAKYLLEDKGTFKILWNNFIKLAKLVELVLYRIWMVVLYHWHYRGPINQCIKIWEWGNAFLPISIYRKCIMKRPLRVGGLWGGWGGGNLTLTSMTVKISINVQQLLLVLVFHDFIQLIKGLSVIMLHTAYTLCTLL